METDRPEGVTTMAKRAKAQALPGMEHRTIPALEQAGAEYAQIRDERMLLTAQEIQLKARVRGLMKKFDRKTYVSAAVEITLEPPDGEDTVKVKVRKPKDADEE